jgi:hypothetical protein
MAAATWVQPETLSVVAEDQRMVRRRRVSWADVVR